MKFWLIYLLVCVSVSVCRGEVPPGVCKDFPNKECKCYQDVNIASWSRNKETIRRLAIACKGPCRALPCCNGASTDTCLNKSRIPFSEQNDVCSSITFVSRKEWGAKPPKQPLSDITHSVPMFYIHHTETPACFNVTACSRSLREIQRFHQQYRATPECANVTACSRSLRDIQRLHQQDRGWWDIAYSFLVGEDGRVYEGRGWGKVGAHTEGYNSVSYAASFIGNFMEKLPNELALNATKNLIECGIQLRNISINYSLYGHKDACGDTDCPGNDLYKLIHSWKNYKRLPNPSAGCVAEGRRCKANVNTCKPGSLITGSSLCLGINKHCCKLG